MKDEAALRREIVQVCRAMVERRLTHGSSGNVSARLGNGLLITPSAVPMDRLEPAMLIHLEDALRHADATSATAAGNYAPSTEWRMHAAILRARADITAVIHAHPPFGTAIACQRRSIPPFHYMVAMAGGDDIRCAEYATYGTPELAENAVAALQDRKACLLANHGTIAIGASLTDALALAIEVEALAESYCHATACGTPVLLSADEMTRVRERFRTYRPDSTS